MNILKIKDEKILSALIECGTIAEASKKAGISRQAIYNRLSDETFKAQYDKLRKNALDEACSTLQATLTEAINTIKSIMQNEETAPQIRLNACGLILQNTLKYVEQQEILTRLEEIEKIVKP